MKGLLLAALPDPSEPTVVAQAAVFGAILGHAFARVRRKPREELSAWTADGAFIFALFGLLAYLGALIAGV